VRRADVHLEVVATRPQPSANAMGRHKAAKVGHKLTLN
jgi:hypothetical protein